MAVRLLAVAVVCCGCTPFRPPPQVAGDYSLVITPSSGCTFPDAGSLTWPVVVGSPSAYTARWWTYLDVLHLRDGPAPGAIVVAWAGPSELFLAALANDHGQPGDPYRTMAGFLSARSAGATTSVMAEGHLDGTLVQAFRDEVLSGRFQGTVRRSGRRQSEILNECVAGDHRWRIERHSVAAAQTAPM